MAADFVRQMDTVFAVDREAAEAKRSAADRHQLRREKTAPVVAKIHQRLLAVKATVLLKSKLGGGG